MHVLPYLKVYSIEAYRGIVCFFIFLLCLWPFYVLFAPDVARVHKTMVVMEMSDEGVTMIWN